MGPQCKLAGDANGGREESQSAGQCPARCPSGTVAGNIATLLLDWGAIINEVDRKKHLNMLLTHQEIAEMVGTTRETVTRTLASFRQHGWIRIHGASMEILQQEKLKDISI